MQVEYNDQIYALDVQRALELGVLKKTITTIEPGDVYEFECGTRLCFIKAGSRNSNFRIIGFNGLVYYSDYPFSKPEGATPEETIDWVNDRSLTFVRNINKDVKKLIKD